MESLPTRVGVKASVLFLTLPPLHPELARPFIVLPVPVVSVPSVSVIIPVIPPVPPLIVFIVVVGVVMVVVSPFKPLPVIVIPPMP